MILICQKVIREHHQPGCVKWFRGVTESSSFQRREVSERLSQLHTHVFDKPLAGKERGVSTSGTRRPANRRATSFLESPKTAEEPTFRPRPCPLQNAAVWNAVSPSKVVPPTATAKPNGYAASTMLCQVRTGPLVELFQFARLCQFEINASIAQTSAVMAYMRVSKTDTAEALGQCVAR